MNLSLKQLIYLKLAEIPSDVYLAVTLLFVLMGYYHFNKYGWVQNAISGLIGLISGFLRGQANSFKTAFEAQSKVTNDKLSKENSSTD